MLSKVSGDFSAISQGSDKCIFCGGIPTTREHVFPRWCHSMITKKKGKYSAVHGTERVASRKIIEHRGKGDIHDWQVKCVCEPRCNNGWMRDLENLAKPIMSPMIRGTSTVLTPSDQRIVSAWATLKAIVGEHEYPNQTSWAHRDKEHLMRVQKPPKRNCLVWIGRYVRGPDWLSFWVTNPLCILPDGHGHILGEPVAYYNSSATTQVIGELFIHIIHGPVLTLYKQLGMKFCATDKLALIWPAKSQYVGWPLHTITDGDAYHTASEMLIDLNERTKRALARRAADAPRF
jgi:hypothetical protein